MALGKGLGALITPTNNNKKEDNFEGRIWQIPLSKIIANSHQPRQNFEEKSLIDLANSIKEHGVLQPVVVVESKDGGYELVAGERRARASKLAGLTTVPAVVKKMKEQQKLEVALIENIQREDLDPIEEAFSYKRLIEEFGLTQEEVSQKVGKSRSAIANSIRLLELPDQIQNALINKKINSGQARALLGLKDEAEQLSMLSSMLGEKISVREIERSVRVKTGYKQSKKDPNIAYLENELRESLGTKVNIKQKGERGSIIIDFYSKEEFESLLDKLK